MRGARERVRHVELWWWCKAPQVGHRTTHRQSLFLLLFQLFDQHDNIVILTKTNAQLTVQTQDVVVPSAAKLGNSAQYTERTTY